MEKWNVGIYIRLSKEDGDKEESNSITNQRNLINDFMSEKNDFIVYDYYIDDGYSGTNFERPSFKRLIDDINKNLVNTVIVKDLSRFGRDYIEVGRYIEQIFPIKKIRFIAINDEIDSYKNPDSMNNIIVPFKNLINDEYCRDISKKVKYALNTRKQNGEFMGPVVPFGYARSAKNKHKLVIDKEAARVVVKIFSLAEKGLGTTKIAQILNNFNIKTPSIYKREKGIYKISDCCKKGNKWSSNMVLRILKNRIYIGEMIQCKYKTISYKVHKRVLNNKENWIIVSNTHDAIVNYESFINVQEKISLRLHKIRSK